MDTKSAAPGLFCPGLGLKKVGQLKAMEALLGRTFLVVSRSGWGRAKNAWRAYQQCRQEGPVVGWPLDPPGKQSLAYLELWDVPEGTAIDQYGHWWRSWNEAGKETGRRLQESERRQAGTIYVRR